MKIRFFSLLALLWAGSLVAAAQSSAIVGTWVLTAADKLLPGASNGTSKAVQAEAFSALPEHPIA
jgi:hypothetical protein